MPRLRKPKSPRHNAICQTFNSMLYNARFVFSFAKKVRMGKRIERALGRDKTSSSATGDSRDDDPNRTPGIIHYI